VPKPGEFLVGLLEFFAILLPGGIAVAVVGPRISAHLLGPVIAQPNGEVELWVYVLVAAYVAGNVLFHLGSFLDPFYDAMRKSRCAAAKRLREAQPPVPLEGALYDAFTNERVYVEATALRKSLMPASQHDAMNTLKWARSLLMARMPAGAEDVHRIEADSKFFRSAVVVCALLALVMLWEHQWIAAAAAAASIIPCFWIYFDRRMKCTTQAYTHAVTLLTMDAAAPTSKET
jgi:hypothetical protein